MPYLVNLLKKIRIEIAVNEDFVKPTIDAIIKDIRRKKAEAMYNDWIERLQKEYTVDINTKMWNKMIGS